MQGIFQKENTDKALKYGIYRHLPTYEKIIRNLVSFYTKIMREHDFCAIRSKTLLLTYENEKSIIGENEKPHMYSYAQRRKT